jgi:flagellar motor switch protein FliG
MATRARLPDQVQDLNGRQKAAVFFMALGRDAAARLSEQLTPEELEKISYEIARLERVSGDVAEEVLREWVDLARAVQSVAAGGVDYAKEILQEALGRREADTVLERIQGQLNESVYLNTLRHVDPQQLSNMLKSEHPQTIALVLAQLDMRQTADVMEELDPEEGSDVLFRMATMEKVTPDLLEMVGRSFADESEFYVSDSMDIAGGPSAVADILNHVPGSVEKTLLDGLRERDRELSEEIQSLMFVFEDLVALDDRSLQRLMREVDTGDLATALKVASDELEERLFSAMTNRAVASVKEEMEFLGPVRVRDVEAAQTKILEQVRTLEEQGEIILASAEELVE